MKEKTIGMRFPFSRKNYHNLNLIEVSEAALRQNHQALKKLHPEAEIAPVLKSNAYGHGLTNVAPIFDTLTAPFLVVDSLYEAYELYKLKVKTPILILGYTHPDNYKIKKLPFDIVVFDEETLKTLNSYQPGCNIHLFVDTGMNREGILLKNLDTFVKKAQHTSLNIVGLCSHLADADNPQDQSFTQFQIENFKQALNILEKNNVHPRYKHIAASGGAFKIKEAPFNLIRAGIASYGLNPLEENDSQYRLLKLKPALTFSSTLVQIKTIHNGDKLGYNCTYTADKTLRVGLLPLGYYEGVARRLSNKGVVTIDGKECPILGRVSMNITLINLTNVPEAKIKDKVIIYSAQSEATNSLKNAAKIAKTIPYELLVHLAESVKRVIM